MAPDNSAGTNAQSPQLPMHRCGQVASYGRLTRTGRATQNPRGTGRKKRRGSRVWERDHVPSKAALFKRAEKMYGLKKPSALYSCVTGKLEDRGMAIVIPRKTHRGFSKTCGKRNTKKLIKDDAATKASLDAAIKRDVAAILKALKGVLASRNTERPPKNSRMGRK